MKNPILSLFLFAAVHASASADPLADQRADLEALKNDYVMQSLAFSAEARQAALAHIGKLQQRDTVMAPPVYAAELMRISAMAGNGHDFFDTGKGWSPTHRLPLRLSWHADGMVVMRAAPQWARLAGARVTRIEGRTLEQLLADLRQFEGGPDAYIRWNKIWTIEQPAMLHAMGIAARDDRVRLTVQHADGRSESVEVEATPNAAQPTDQGRIGSWSTAASPKEQELGWVNAVRAQEDPLYLREPGRLYRTVELPQLDALYVQFRANFDGKNEPVAEFARQVQEQLAATSRSHLILDQRFNVGGNSDLTETLMRQIGKRIKGRTYLLVGPRTFSAGIVSSGIVVHESSGKAIIVGEGVGDRLRWWSEGRHTCLPHSRHCVHITDGLWDIQRGCAGEKACYGDRFGIRIKGLDPHLSAPLTAAAWMAGRDPAMEAVAADLSTPKGQ